MPLPRGVVSAVVRHVHALAGVRAGETFVHLGDPVLAQELGKRWGRTRLFHIAAPGEATPDAAETVVAHPLHPPMLDGSMAALLATPHAWGKPGLLQRLDAWVGVVCAGGRILVVVEDREVEPVEGFLSKHGAKSKRREIARGAGEPVLRLDLVHGTLPWD